MDIPSYYPEQIITKAYDTSFNLWGVVVSSGTGSMGGISIRLDDIHQCNNCDYIQGGQWNDKCMNHMCGVKGDLKHIHPFKKETNNG